MRAILRAVSLAGLLGAIALACGEDRPLCYRGDSIGCNCADGAYGYSACAADESGYGACVCDGTTPGVDAGPRDASVEDTTKLPLFVSCSEATQCESGVCFTYGEGQSLCSKLCSSPADCPAPSPGCNGKGACRPP